MMLSTFWDWLKKQSLKSQTTGKIGSAKTVSQQPVAPGLADTQAWTPTTRTNGQPQQTTYDMLQNLMKQLGPEDHMTMTPRGYFVTTKPGSPPRRDLPVDVFGPQQEDEEDGLAPS